jgi:hypothetical protein
MFPNVTADGRLSVNTTNLNATGDLNATRIFQAGLAVLTSFTETDPLWDENVTAFNNTWSSTYNSTYDAKPSNTFNSTYNTWSLTNQTLPALLYANAQFINMTNTSWALTQLSANQQFMNITNATQLFMNMTNTSWVTAITNPYYLNMSNTSNWNLNKYWMGTLAWNNISARNLDIAWTGTLGWENLTARSLNIVWSGTLDASNISGIISKAQLSPQVYFVNNTGLSADNITSGTVSIARLHTNIKWVNSTQTLTGGNITALTNSSLNQSWAMMYSNITGGFPAAWGRRTRRL